ncbi:hypothetical protein [Anaerosphaera multitolerans]|uniref:Uncharacterized protein n=1 Tax=Anaerosphaera multitolerans TaxID=2487351 RepID=A0A437S572_9FIRM|nr:hypothetical protein [Anaerosphaera multitolerans]RVU54160.1 hypothetical protein EF514_08780 [Anaerosphaera multitolerans]
MDYEKNLNVLKDELEKAKNLKYKAEARLEQLNLQRDMLINEIQEMGIEPDNLELQIEKLKKEIDSLFEEANKLMPRD